VWTIHKQDPNAVSSRGAQNRIFDIPQAEAAAAAEQRHQVS